MASTAARKQPAHTKPFPACGLWPPNAGLPKSMQIERKVVVSFSKTSLLLEGIAAHAAVHHLNSFECSESRHQTQLALHPLWTAAAAFEYKHPRFSCLFVSLVVMNPYPH